MTRRSCSSAAARRRPQRHRRLRGRPRDALGARARRHARAREQGEPRRRGRARARGPGAGRRPAAPGRQRALGAHQCLEGREPETVAGLVLTASGGPFRGRIARRARGRHAGGGARASDVAHGPEDHGRLGDAREQGPRADRGALALRRPRTSGSRSSCIRPRSSTRSCASATGPLLAHLGLPDMRVPISFALTYPERARRPPSPQLAARGARRSRSRRRDDERLPAAALARAAGERGGTFPCAYNAANEVAVAAFLDGRIGFPDIADGRRGDARARRRRARARPRRPRRRRRRGPPPRRRRLQPA